MRHLPLVVTIVGIVLTFVSTFLGAMQSPGWSVAAGGVSALAAIAGAFWMDRAGQPFVRHFAEADWRKVGDGYQIELHAATHRKPHGAAVAIYMAREGGKAELVICDVETSDDGSVTLKVTPPFTGYVTIG